MIMPAVKLASEVIWAPHRFIEVLDDWGDDAFDFLRHQVPRIVAVLVIAFVLAGCSNWFHDIWENSAIARTFPPRSVPSSFARCRASFTASESSSSFLSPRCRSCLCWGSTWDHCWPALGLPA